MDKQLNIDMALIARQFQPGGECLDARSYGTGHIHDTYLVNIRQKGRCVPYIFQRINRYVFPDPPGVMENIVRVTRHIRQKLETQGISEGEIDRRVLRVIPTHDGGSYYLDPENNYWRAYVFIRGARTYDVLSSNEQLFQVAYMFGRFMAMLEDLAGPPLHETIPDFHNGRKRLKDFQEALASDSHNRAAAAKSEIDFLLDRASMFDILPGLVQEGKIPVRITHNDTKVNNIMLDDITGEGVCVIDLDTVMSGLSLYDFGDLGRTTLSPMAEDERDLSGVSVELSRFETILNGFLVGVGGSLNRVERNYLVFSIKLMTLLIGMRFLTDYLQGDPYYKVHREGHNLDRCRRQFRLVQSITDCEEEMNAIVERQHNG
ncbi:MAG: phosphotransferase [Candidatus Aminicenantes bacterium]|nr:phosphotransferase [Candidatus Aminicenantes bacterium]NIM81093.1 phosphotransferase [Candidatus Aminicenantes bacterium]NIN20467.1 phosphotransferase [Candidatus Aminicenantes bacterium]NIN44240.1 phosphotransferase [Candidatus Aminicenantes bacterium]NIN87059.1 phosphotransferase [Candidatus Aminicenantes bacterium]